MSIVTEHEQVFLGGSFENQPEQSQDIVKKVNKLLSRAKKFRQRFDKDWRLNYEFVVNGRQWPTQRPRWRFQEAVNITWSTIMTEVAIQTDARPKFEFTPQEITDDAFAKIATEVVDRIWERQKWNDTLAMGLLDCKLYHVSHMLIGWDQELESGLGDISLELLDPFFCYWDPMASDVNKGEKARYFIYAKPIPTSRLKMDYPDHAEDIKPDIAGLDPHQHETVFGKVSLTYDPFSPSRLPSVDDRGHDQREGMQEDKTMLIRCWMRDDTLEEVAGEDPDKPFVVKKKFPTGRYVEMANNILLRDGPPGTLKNGEWVPYASDKFPVARLVNYQYPREYAGENEVTHLKGPQKIANYVWSYILDSFRMAANPKILISSDANINPRELTNEPGTAIITDNMNGYRQEAGAPIAAGAFNVLDTSLSFMDRVQGLQEVSRGANQPGVTSGVLFEGFIEAAQTRPRFKNRFLETFLQDVGEHVMDRIMQFYTEPRIFRITDKEGYPEFVEFFIPQKDGQRVASIRVVKQDDNGQPMPAQSAEIPIKGQMDVKVTSGSQLPFAKAQRANTAMTFFKNGAIDREELLKSVDWPNREEVLKRVEELEQQAAAAATEQVPTEGVQ